MQENEWADVSELEYWSPEDDEWTGKHDGIWNAPHGNARVQDGKLVMDWTSGRGFILNCIEHVDTLSGAEGNENFVIEVFIDVYGGSDGQAWILFNYNPVAGTYYYVAFSRDNWVKLKSWDGSTATDLVTVDWPTVGTALVARVCVTPTSCRVQWAEDVEAKTWTFILASAVTVEPHQYVGLGTTGHQLFGPFLLERSGVDQGGCKKCEACCPACAPPCYTGQKRVTIQDVGSLGCDMCLSLNDTFILDYVGCFGRNTEIGYLWEAIWRYEFDPPLTCNLEVYPYLEYRLDYLVAQGAAHYVTLVGTDGGSYVTFGSPRAGSEIRGCDDDDTNLHFEDNYRCVGGTATVVNNDG